MPIGVPIDGGVASNNDDPAVSGGVDSTSGGDKPSWIAAAAAARMSGLLPNNDPRGAAVPSLPLLPLLIPVARTVCPPLRGSRLPIGKDPTLPPLPPLPVPPDRSEFARARPARVDGGVVPGAL